MIFSRTGKLLLPLSCENAAEWGMGLIGTGRLSDHVPIAAAVELKPADSLKIVLTATEDRKPARPHQAFLLIRDQDTGLETTFPFSVKESGKAKVELVRPLIP